MIQDDGDIVRAMGYVALYSSYLEEQIENMISMLNLVLKYEKGSQVSDKIRHAKKILRTLGAAEFANLISDLDTCAELLRDRNKYMHRQIYSGLGRPDTLKSTDPNIVDEVVLPSQLYQLANELSDFRQAVYRPMIFQIPNKIQNAMSSGRAYKAHQSPPAAAGTLASSRRCARRHDS
ncbi:MAG: hypothetical protein Q7L19_01730 [Pseudohongiella sp.]|nr:hypothetical protein [Pseudohongiella sp.]